jgi:hypothetical protein
LMNAALASSTVRPNGGEEAGLPPRGCHVRATVLDT